MPEGCRQPPQGGALGAGTAPQNKGGCVQPSLRRVLQARPAAHPAAHLAPQPAAHPAVRPAAPARSQLQTQLLLWAGTRCSADEQTLRCPDGVIADEQHPVNEELGAFLLAPALVPHQPLLCSHRCDLLAAGGDMGAPSEVAQLRSFALLVWCHPAPAAARSVPAVCQGCPAISAFWGSCSVLLP